MTPAIRTQGLTKRFGSRTAFEDLTFEVAPGEIFGFLGPNGAGKTTTVRVLATLLSPTAGTAEVAGIPLGAGRGSELRRHIGVMTEAPGLYAKLSVAENLAFFAGLYEVREPDRKIGEALELAGLSDRRDELAGALSKGLRQRASLARALINDPQILFLDEPTSGLDPEATIDVRNLIEGLRARGTTVFLTTHRLEEAAKVCDRVAILKTRMRAVGPPDQLRHELFGTAIEVVVASSLPDPSAVFATVPGLHNIAQDNGSYLLDVSDARAAAPAIARALVSAGADVLRIAEKEHSLEEAYLEIVEDQQ
jgi:ABC-2 type transport system ATP-binding protein